MTPKDDKLSDNMKKILFICTGNTCRSPMAQGIFNSICRERELPFDSRSAGLCTVTGLPVSENSVSVLKESGIDISDLKSTSIADVDTEEYSLFAVMTPEHRDMLLYYGFPPEKIYVLAEDKGGISDPYGGNGGRYRICRDEINAAIEELIHRLGDEDGNKET